MVNKCVCGKYTDFGTLCVRCAMTASTGELDINLDIDVEDYIEDEEEEEND